MAIFTGRVERAIALALRAHEAQVRKGDGQLPYVVHPVTVALILSRYTGDEDTIIAGLLHDAIEDTSVTAEMIEREFGEKVRDTVLDVDGARPARPLVGNAQDSLPAAAPDGAAPLPAGGGRRQGRKPDLDDRRARDGG